MDRWGIEKAVVLPLSNSPHGWYLRATTEDVLARTNRFAGRLIPFCQIDPRFGDNSPQTDFGWILAEYKERGCKGMGEVTANMFFDDPMVVNLMKQCGEANLPVLFHAAHCIGGTYGLVDDAGLPRLERLLQAAPDTVFCAHGPAFWSEISADVDDSTRGGYPKGSVAMPGRAAELLDRYPNLYVDLSAHSGYNALTRTPEYGLKFLDRFQDKLLFGTDILSADMGEEAVPIIGFMRDIREDGRISEDAYGKIMHRNAARLLRLT